MRALNLKTIRQIDKSSMLDLLSDFNLQCLAAYDIAKKSKINFQKRDFKRIVFSGLGGSAIGGDLVKSYLYFESKLPILVFREYNLPAFLDEDTLVFISSYSGNTEETLSAYQEAKARGAHLVCISSDGKLKENCLNDGFSFIEIPAGFPPRCALGYLSIIPLVILERLGIVSSKEEDIKEVISILKDLKNNCLNPQIGQKENIAKYIAKKIFNKFVFIYSTSINFDVAATRLRAELNENAKSLATSHLFPEMNHNEIEGFKNPAKLFKNFIVLLFNDKGIHPRVKKRMEITKEILKKEGLLCIEISSWGESLLSRIFSLIYIGDFISFYLSILYGIDPTPVDRITYLKKRLIS